MIRWVEHSGQDGASPVARPAELDIFGPDAPESGLHLGEGMLARADSYADFLRMLLRHGSLGEPGSLQHRSVETLYAPHTPLTAPTPTTASSCG